MKTITSSSNPLFRSFSSLLQSKGIKKEGLVLVSGKKIVPEVMTQFKDHLTHILYTDSLETSFNELSKKYPDLFSINLSSPLFKELDDSNSRFPLVVMKAPQLSTYQESKPGLNVFLSLSDPSNLGAALRSLKAFNASQVILTEECAHPFLPKVTKTASGSNLAAPIVKGPSIQELKIKEPICLDMEGESLKNFSWPKTANLVLGEEGQGVPEKLKNTGLKLKIEMNSEIESLSAPIALSIAAHHHYLKSTH